jgi:hypothetical protein
MAPEANTPSILSSEEELELWTAQIEEAFNAPFKDAQVVCGDADLVTPWVITIHMYSQNGEIEIVEFMIPEQHRIEGFSSFYAVSPTRDVWIPVWSKDQRLTIWGPQDLRDEPFSSQRSISLTAPYIEENGVTHYRTYATARPGLLDFTCEGVNK